MNNNQKIYRAIYIITIVLGVVTRIFTPGWTWFLFFGPIEVHVIVLFICLEKLTKMIDEKKFAIILFSILCITFLGACLLYPNFGDEYNFILFNKITDITNEGKLILDDAATIATRFFIINILTCVFTLLK